MQGHANRIGIAGSHGKSTVTAMLAHILTAAGRAPAVFCGAPLRGVSEEPRVQAQDAVFEACEYGDSFLRFSPTLAVLLNADHDHVDYFPTREALKRSFCTYAALPGKTGVVLCNAEDMLALSCAQTSEARLVTFGVDDGDFRARVRKFSAGCGVFTPVLSQGRELPEIRLRVPGCHNISNAMAAIAAADLLGVTGETICAALSAFPGVGRRMEYRGTLGGARLYDDYAHHPREIVATLTAAREMAGKGRLLAVFQSHTYTRTKAFLAEICAALRLADRVLIAPIYPARETDTLGMSADVLAAGVGERATACQTLSEVAAALTAELMAGDLAVVMGAGDVDRIFREIF